MTVQNALAGVAVTDLKASKAWYEKLFGRQPDTNPMSELFEWKFPTGGWLQLFENRNLAGSSSVTLVENDFKKRVSELKSARYDIKKLVESEKINVAIIEDPDGNQVVFAQGKGEQHKAVE